MIEIREVKTKKEIKQFIELPLKMYKDCPYFVPPLYMPEILPTSSPSLNAR